MRWGNFLLLGLLIGGGAIAGLLWRAERRRNVACYRLSTDSWSTVVADRVNVFPPRFRWVAPLSVLVTAAMCWQWLDWPMPLAVAVGSLIGALGFIIESTVAARHALRLEMQLTEVIDGLVGSLRVGLALPKALEMATHEVKPPLHAYLEDVAARLRLGNDAVLVFHELARRIPLESVTLFTLTLSTQWATGGRIATSLAAVGRTIRDRIEVSRRVAAQAVEARMSVVAMMGISYGLAWIMYRANPKQFVMFFMSDLGVYLLAGGILLQVIGIVWITHLSHIRY